MTDELLVRYCSDALLRMHCCGCTAADALLVRYCGCTIFACIRSSKQVSATPQKNKKNKIERKNVNPLVFLGDAVVVCGTEKKSLVLLPAGQTWFAWAEGQRVRDQLRSLQLQTLGAVIQGLIH